MLICIILLLQAFDIGHADDRLTPNQERDLIKYVIDLYYYPNQPNMTKYSDPTKIRGFKSRHYYFDYINCLHDTDIKGVVDAIVNSHTICISLCDDQPGCKGGLYSRERKKCYLLQDVKCATEAQHQAYNARPNLGDRWQVFFFYNVDDCEKDQTKGSQCDQETTTSAVGITQAVRQPIDDPTSEHAGRQSVSDIVPIPNNAPYVVFSMARGIADPTQRVAQVSMAYKPERRLIATSTRVPATTGSLQNMLNFASAKFGSTSSSRRMGSYERINSFDVDEVELFSRNPSGRPASPGENTHLRRRNNAMYCSQFVTSVRRRKRAPGGQNSGCGRFLQKAGRTFEFLKQRRDYARLLEKEATDKIKQMIKDNKLKVISPHMRRFTRVAKGAAMATVALTLFEDIYNGNIKGIIINLSIFAVTFAAAKLLGHMTKLGTILLAKGSLKAGLAMLAVGPLLQCIGTAYLAYELYGSIKNLNTSNPDTIADLTAKAILFAVEVFQLGLLVAVALGSTIAASIASVAGPAGVVIAVLVFVGLRIYYVVRQVEEIEKVVPLTGWERFREGGKRFFTGSGLESVDILYKTRSGNNKMSEVAIEELKSEEFKTVFVAATKVVGDDRHIEIAQDRKIDLVGGKSLRRVSRAAPQISGNYEGVCLPTDNDDYEKEENDFNCQDAFGVSNRNAKNAKNHKFALYDGNDEVDAAEVNNTFMLSDGRKNIRGNNKHDIFVLLGKNTHGKLEGKNGHDVVYAYQFHPGVASSYFATANSDMSISHYDFKSNSRQYINALGIEELHGRPGDQDSVIVPCDLKFLSTYGGKNKVGGRDSILLDEKCKYNITILVAGGSTVIKNNAKDGLFIYQLVNLTDSVLINLKNESNQNVFIFNYHIKDLLDMKKIGPNYLMFAFKDHTNDKKFAKVSVKNYEAQTTFAFKDKVNIVVGKQSAYLMVISELNVNSIFQKYQPITEKLGLILKAKSKADDMVIIKGHGQHSFSMPKDKSRNVLSNDFKEITHFYPGSVQNTYLINADEETYNGSTDEFSIPKMYVHYDAKPDTIDQVELSILVYQLRLKFNAALDIHAEADYGNNDVILKLYLADLDGSLIHPGQPFSEVVLKNVILNSGYKNIMVITGTRLSINVTSNSAMIDSEDLTESDLKVHLLPQPIVFTDGASDDKDIFVITDIDVWYGSLVKINRTMGDLDNIHYILSNGTLIITNALNSDCKIASDGKPMCTTIMLNGFATSPILQTIYIDLEDIMFSMEALINIQHVLDLSDSSHLLDQVNSESDPSGSE